ncbi:hypothetical protein Taro_006567, partial [Colocasia esculenta]|nr:hypothetical protein [Colocasia esculenta]
IYKGSHVIDHSRIQSSPATVIATLISRRAGSCLPTPRRGRRHPSRCRLGFLLVNGRSLRAPASGTLSSLFSSASLSSLLPSLFHCAPACKGSRFPTLAEITVPAQIRSEKRGFAVPVRDRFREPAEPASKIYWHYMESGEQLHGGSHVGNTTQDQLDPTKESSVNGSMAEDTSLTEKVADGSVACTNILDDNDKDTQGQLDTTKESSADGSLSAQQALGGSVASTSASENREKNQVTPDPVVGMAFETEQTAYDCYSEYGKRNGFTVRWDNRTLSRRTGVTLARRFVCSKQGRRGDGQKKRHSLAKYHREETRCGCLAYMKIKLASDGKYRIIELNSTHNHPLACQVPVNYSLANLVLYNHPLANQVANIRPVPIQVANIRPVPNQVPNIRPVPIQVPNIRPLPNQVPNIRPLPTQLPNIRPLPNQVPYNHPVAVFVPINPQIQGHPLGNKVPPSPMLANPHAAHVVIMQRLPGAQASVAKKIKRKRKSADDSDGPVASEATSQDVDTQAGVLENVASLPDEAEFLEGWKSMLEKYGLVDNTWLRQKFQEREKWAPVYGRTAFCADLKSAQHRERINKELKRYLSSARDIESFLQNFDKFLEDKRNKELEANSKMTKSSPYAPPVSIIQHAARVYTSAVFDMFMTEYVSGLECLVKDRQYEEPTQILTVEDGQRHDHIVRINFDEEILSCSCCKFENVGILCGHLLTCITKRMRSIPQRYILKRWTRCAGSLSVTYHANTTVEDPRCILSQRYSSLVHDFVQLSVRAAEDEDLYNCAMKHKAAMFEEMEKVFKEKTSSLSYHLFGEHHTSKLKCSV